MATAFEIWAVPLGKKRKVYFGEWDLDRWQWAEKYAAFLKDKGHEGVEIREVEAEGPDGVSSKEEPNN